MAYEGMTYQETEARRMNAIRELGVAEGLLYVERQRALPMKDAQFSSELSRKTAMEAGTAIRQAEVDTTIRELEVLADGAKYLIATVGNYTVDGENNTNRQP